MHSYEWKLEAETDRQLESLLAASGSPGYLVVSFDDGAAGAPAPWPAIERWTRSRAVTVSDVRGAIRGGALEVAACSDLVLVRGAARFELPPASEPPSRALVWALARAGRAALACGLLEGEAMTARRAVELGVAHRLMDGADTLPLPDAPSVAALTAARDLMRSPRRGSAGRALELATFSMLFASGDPEEGARSFLERRTPRFMVERREDGQGGGDGH